jgi:hypothetical protein
MPEVFDVNFSKAVALQYPLRPGNEAVTLTAWWLNWFRVRGINILFIPGKF